MAKRGQPARLRAVEAWSRTRLECRSMSFTAASPLGVLVRPCSISHTADVDKPISSPISASVKSHLTRRSVMRDAHVVMEPILRLAEKISQRPGVTEFRENRQMPRPHDMPEDLNTPGKRCRWWREYRERTEPEAFAQGRVAKDCRIAQGTLSDFENGSQKTCKNMHLLVAKLRLNPWWVENGKGEPEAGYPQEPPEEPNQWPVRAVPPKKISGLNDIEFSYAENRLLIAIQEIERARKSSKGS